MLLAGKPQETESLGRRAGSRFWGSQYLVIQHRRDDFTTDANAGDRDDLVRLLEPLGLPLHIP